MTRNSPIAAMLWENWRLTRVEAAQRLAVGIVAASAALSLANPNLGPTVAFWTLITVHSMIWLSIAKLNGGRFMDGYKPGFAFYLLYTRPVRTITFVAVAMAYDAISCTLLYVASAAIVNHAFGQSLPVFSVTLALLSYHLAYACCQWATRNRAVQWLGAIAFSIPMIILLRNGLTASLQVELSAVENIVFILIGVASFVLTVAGVARQRRGDAVATASQPRAVSGAYPNWLINAFRLPCPSASATRAQLWFELRSSGLPVLTIGLVVALVIFLAVAIGAPVAVARNVAIPIAMFAVIVAVFGLGNNAFGIRRKQGRIYASAFESTLPCRTAQLAGLKVLVRTACLLFALIVIGACLWASSSFLNSWGEWLADGNKDALPDLLKLRQKFSREFGNLTGYAQAALAVIAAILVAAVVAWQAAREALRARFPRLLLAWQWLPPLWVLAFILLSVAAKHSTVLSPATVHTFFLASFWTSSAAILLAAIYLLWNGIRERVLTIRDVCAAMLVPAALGIAWFTGMPAPSVTGMLWLVLLTLMIGFLAPWSLSRVRHT
jgi:hypothetical protein